MWQGIVVGLIVVVAGVYVAWALLPATLRLRIAQGIGAWGCRPGRAAWLGRACAAVERGARARLGGCSDCSSVQAAPQSPAHRQPPPE